MNGKTSADLRAILEDSLKSQLLSICVAARGAIDVDAFDSYSSADVANDPAYKETLRQLRALCVSSGAEYIYALKPVGGEYVFVFDTDTENEEIFIPYELSPVHTRAFGGVPSADVLNVDDEYGSFNTGAVPIIKGGRVIGIISVDITDVYLKQSTKSAVLNIVILAAVLVAAMVGACVLIGKLMWRVQKMQDKLERIAHYDAVTGLPNRKYLLDYLQENSGKDKPPYALLFIDLDNFKLVNDSAGHDAGDETLRSIAQFLESECVSGMSFRPTPGKLNIAARIGGDEFIQVVSGVNSEEDAALYGEKLLAEFHARVRDRHIEKYGVGLSIGIALHPYHSNNFHVLIKYADIAMYHAKKSGKNQYMVYNDELEQKIEK